VNQCSVVLEFYEEEARVWFLNKFLERFQFQKNMEPRFLLLRKINSGFGSRNQTDSGQRSLEWVRYMLVNLWFNPNSSPFFPKKIPVLILQPGPYSVLELGSVPDRVPIMVLEPDPKSALVLDGCL